MLLWGKGRLLLRVGKGPFVEGRGAHRERRVVIEERGPFLDEKGPSEEGRSSVEGLGRDPVFEKRSAFVERKHDADASFN